MSQLYPGYWRGGGPTRQTPRTPGRRNKARTFLFGANGGSLVYGSDGVNWKVFPTGIVGGVFPIATYQYAVVCCDAGATAVKGTRDIRSGVWQTLTSLFSANCYVHSFDGGFFDTNGSALQGFWDHNFQPINAGQASVGAGGISAPGQTYYYVGRLRGRSLFIDGGNPSPGSQDRLGYSLGGWTMSTDFGPTADVKNLSPNKGDIPILGGQICYCTTNNILTILTADPGFRSIKQLTTTALTPSFNISSSCYFAVGNGLGIVQANAQNGFAVTRDWTNWQLVNTNNQTGRIPGPVILWNGEMFAAPDVTGAGILTSFDGFTWAWQAVAFSGTTSGGTCSDFVIA